MFSLSDDASKIARFVIVVVDVVDYQTLPRDGGLAEDHGAPEVGQLPRAWTRGCRETEVAKESVGKRVRSWTVQNEMRGILGELSAGAAGRILDSANHREIRI